MGRNLLRRETVAALCLLFAAAPLRGGHAADRAADVRPLASVSYLRPDSPAAASEPVEELPLRPLPAAPREEETFTIPIPEEAAIDAFLAAFLQTRRDWLAAMLERTQLYRGVISERIRDLGLPEELLFLPAVESGFRASAVSRRGASGLWQLMRNTASPYGLAMDPWIDERKDFWKATDASLAKLADDRRLFGDWHLALAAYNCGAARLSRIIRQSGISDYWRLRRSGLLPRETAAFVPQFLAVTRILKRPALYGLAPPWTPPVSWTRVPVDRCVDLGLLAKASGVPYDLLRAGNAELTLAITPPAGYRYQLKVPEEFRQSVETALDSEALPLMDLRIHTIRPGDTLSGIARSYGVTAAMIAGFNPAARPQALRIGGTLLVPARPRQPQESGTQEDGKGGSG